MRESDRDPDAVIAVDPHPDSARSRMLRTSLVWSLANSLSGRLLTVGAGMVLARLLTPREYGTYAIAFLVLTIVQSMNELGVSVALLRSATDPTPLAPTAVTLSVGSSSVLYALVALVAPLLADALRAPGATNVIRLVALNLILDSISSVPNALLSRSFQQARRTVVDLGALVPGAAVSISLAAAGWGPISLAWGSLAGNVTAVVLVYLLAPSRPLPGWSVDHARSLLRAGVPLAATSLVYLATLNVDYVVVSRMLGTEALGFYVLAFNLSSWPSSLLSLSIRRVAIPGFAQMAEDREALGIAFVRSMRLLAAVAVLATLLLSMLAEPLVTILYGDTWLHAVVALRWLAVLGGMRLLLDLGYDTLVAVGASRFLLVVQVIWLTSLVAAIPLGARLGGIAGVGAGHVFVAAAVTGTAYLVALNRAGLPVAPLASALAGPAVAGLMTAGLLALALRLDRGPWAALVVMGGASTLVYAALLGAQRAHRPLVLKGLSRIGRRWARPTS